MLAEVFTGRGYAFRVVLLRVTLPVAPTACRSLFSDMPARPGVYHAPPSRRAPRLLRFLRKRLRVFSYGAVIPPVPPAARGAPLARLFLFFQRM